MNIFKTVRNFMTTAPESDPNWSIPQGKTAINEILNSVERPQIIYKHSYRCSISLLSKRGLDSGMNQLKGKADAYLIDVVSMWELSDYVAEKTGIRHESPQVILLNKGAPYWSASHGSVRFNALQDAVQELTAEE